MNISLTNAACSQPPKSTQPGHPSVCRCSEYSRTLGRAHALAPCPWFRSENWRLAGG